MFKKTFLSFQVDFENKTRFSWVWPRCSYGTIFLMKGADRRIPMYNLKFITTEKNRLENFLIRYGKIYEMLDNEKNLKELNVDKHDVRWYDYRKLNFHCKECNTDFALEVYKFVRYGDGCPNCVRRYTGSRLLGNQQTTKTILSDRPDLLKDVEKVNNYTKNLPITSRVQLRWRCRLCRKGFLAPVRLRTGEVEPTQTPLLNISKEMSRYCIDCQWKATKETVGKQIREQKSYLGLSESFNETKENECKFNVRRSKFVSI